MKPSFPVPISYQKERPEIAEGHPLFKQIILCILFDKE
jgi:hypothetical protein